MAWCFSIVSWAPKLLKRESASEKQRLLSGWAIGFSLARIRVFRASPIEFIDPAEAAFSRIERA